MNLPLNCLALIQGADMSEHESQSEPTSESSDGPDTHAVPVAPAALVSDLSDLFNHSVDTSSLDRTILASAKAHFADNHALALASESPAGTVTTPAPIRAWWARWRIAEVAGLAAAIGLIVWISSAGPFGDAPPSDLPGGTPIAVVGDVDRNGKVDILDAYLLQRSINAGNALQSDWDMTGDGQVNRDDVSAVAMLAVKLDGGQRL